VPGEWKSIMEVDAKPAASPDAVPLAVNFIGIDTDFLATYEMELASGRNFSEAQGRDSAAVLLNETAARQLGVALPLRGEPEVRLARQTSNEEIVLEARVVGVVEDFHFRSLHESIGPIVLGFRNNPFQSIDYFTARVSGEDLEGVVAHFDAVHARFAPETPIEYNFLDDRWSDFYTNDRRVERLFGVASLLAIVIACLGLFGLAAFTAERRTREIGIRKVLGADVRGIVWMLNREFAVLVGVAFVLATPAAFFAMRGWLADFAYRIDLGAGPFLGAGLAALVVALLTVSYQSVRAARANPADSLRTE
jgi:putative ABC transport system permease protein